MPVIQYSKSRQGNLNLSRNFRVAEFACHDGSDTILVDTALVTMLQKVRDHFGRQVIVTSAYRTPSWNKKQGGATASYHLKGMAADIVVFDVSPIDVALYAQSIGAGGVGLYLYPGGMFVHIDSRAGKARWIQAKKTGGYTVVPSIFPTVRKGSHGAAVRLLQRGLGLKEDGIFGPDTRDAVLAFQRQCFTAIGEHDGLCGAKTWEKVIKKLNTV